MSKTEEIVEDPSLEKYADGSANILLALTFPNYTAENRDRFVEGFQQIQDVVGDKALFVIWGMIIAVRLGREITDDELRAIEPIEGSNHVAEDIAPVLIPMITKKVASLRSSPGSPGGRPGVCL